MLPFDLKNTVSGDTPAADAALNARAAAQGIDCEYCGYSSRDNTALWRDGHPLHDQDDNLTVVDPFCRAWRELNTLTADTAVMVMLPGLSAQDINHFQRTLQMALGSDEPALREAARALLDWLTEHQSLTHSAFGCAHPGAFAAALHRTPPARRPAVQQAWQGLAPALNPARLPPRQDLTDLESTPAWWPLMYHHYLTHR